MAEDINSDTIKTRERSSSNSSAVYSWKFIPENVK